MNNCRRKRARKSIGLVGLIAALVVGCAKPTSVISSANAVTTFEFRASDNPGLAADVIAAIDGSMVSATLPGNVDPTHLVATFTAPGARVSVNGTVQHSGQSANDFTHPLILDVTAADGTTATYTVAVTFGAQGGSKDITAFSFFAANNPTLITDVFATVNGTTITADVPAGIAVSSLVANFITTGVSVTVNGVPQASGSTHNDFASPVQYVVHAADSSTQSYNVTVRSFSGAKDITSYAFLASKNPQLSGDVVGTITGTEIVAEVPPGTEVRNLIATFTITGVSIAVGVMPQMSGVSKNDFTNPVVYFVNAGDMTQQSYTVTVVTPADSVTGLVAHYRGDGVDRGPFHRDATKHGAVAVAADRFGVMLAASFSGNEADYFEVTGFTQLPDAAMPRSMAMWVKTTFAGTGDVVCYGSAATMHARFGELVKGGSEYFVGQNDDLSGTVRIDDDAWHSIIVTFDGVSVVQYIDGNVDNATIVSLGTTTKDLEIGRAPADYPIAPKEPYSGLLDDIRIFDPALVATEIATLANDHP